MKQLYRSLSLLVWVFGMIAGSLDEKKTFSIVLMLSAYYLLKLSEGEK